VLVTATLTGTTLPIQPLQLLWLSMIAVLMLGPPLTAEPPADHLMRRPPPTRTLFGPQRSARILLAMLVFLGGAFGLFHWELAHGTTPAQARTAVVNVLAFTLLTYLLGCRSAGRPSAHRNAGQHLLMAVSVTVLITLQLAYTHVPVLNELFGSAPLGGASWLAVVVVAMSGFVLTEAVKRLPTQLRGVPAAQHS
jgi:cation-transporting ATPase F